jgi:DNA-binding beta-propeller fold protein YncE
MKNSRRISVHAKGRFCVRNSRIVFCLCIIGFSAALFAQSYKITNRISFPGDTGWDYLFADSANRQLYVSHGNGVEVINLDSQKPVAKITGLNRIHGIAVADDLNHGFISDGGDSVVVMFDLKSHAVLQKVNAGKNPDSILFDPATKRVFAFNGRSQNATAIDASNGDVIGTIDLSGRPEYAASDGKGKIYDNIEDKSEIIQINAATLKIENRWSISPCEGPSGLAIDASSKRLFAVCSNQMMAVVDAESGKVIVTLPIGKGPDATVYDAAKKLVFSSNGRDGTLTIIKQDSADKYEVAATVQTEMSARTMALDAKTHDIYLSAAQLGPPQAATAENPHPWPKIVPGSFHVLVVSPN